MPIFTAFFAALFPDEQITLTTVLCGAAIVFGLWLGNRERSRPAARRPSSRSVESGQTAPAPE